MQRKIDRPHFKKTLLCDIVMSPSMQSMRSNANMTAPCIPSNYSNQYAQRPLSDRSDSFSHMDFTLFDLPEDVEEGVISEY